MLYKKLYIILKVTKKCNLDCTYCYVSRDECKHMSETLATRCMEEISSISESANIILHGGEPLMAGKKFFNLLLDSGKNKNLTYNIQTNGLLIDNQWTEIFKEHKIAVGISVDGPKLIHDKYRIAKNGQGSFLQVMKNVKLVEKEGFDLNCLCVITKESLINLESIFDFFENSPFKTIDFIPCIMEDSSKIRNPENLTISPKEYASFMIQYVELWKKSKRKYTIRSYNDFINILHGNDSQTCIFLYPKVCGMEVLSIDTNGDVYPCDSFAGHKDMCLGNIANEKLSSILLNARHKAFIASANSLPVACTVCRYLKYCYGGCAYHRYIMSKDMKKSSFYCESNKLIFKYILKSFNN